jgi:uncharacterized protein (DUF433 family)
MRACGFKKMGPWNSLRHKAKMVVARYSLNPLRKVQIMSTQDRIEMNPKVMLGKPVIRGTRITVEIILRKLGEGASHRELLEAYPNLTERDIQSAITYAAEVLAHEETVLVEPQG